MNKNPTFPKEISDLLDELFFDLTAAAKQSLSLFRFQLDHSVKNRIREPDIFRQRPIWQLGDFDAKGNEIWLQYDYDEASCSLTHTNHHDGKGEEYVFNAFLLTDYLVERLKELVTADQNKARGE
jgi:hypothetical protein